MPGMKRESVSFLLTEQEVRLIEKIAKRRRETKSAPFQKYARRYIRLHATEEEIEELER